MIINLAVIFIVEKESFPNEKYEFQDFDLLIKIMEKYQDKVVRRNVLHFLAKICKKLQYYFGNFLVQKKTRDFLIDTILKSNNRENLNNALKCLLYNIPTSFDIIKNTGCLPRMISLIRFEKNLYSSL